MENVLRLLAEKAVLESKLVEFNTLIEWQSGKKELKQRLAEVIDELEESY